MLIFIYFTIVLKILGVKIMYFSEILTSYWKKHQIICLCYFPQLVDNLYPINYISPPFRDTFNKDFNKVLKPLKIIISRRLKIWYKIASIYSIDGFYAKLDKS